MRSLNAQNQYNLTIIEPSFPIDPWYADNPNDPSLQFETFMTKDLVPWVTQNLEPPAGSRALLATAGRRAELADRVLEVGHRRTGSDPQASGRLRRGGVMGLSRRHGRVRRFRVKLGE